MKPILVLTVKKDSLESIKETFLHKAKIYHAMNWEDCLEQFASRRHEYTFIDIHFLLGEQEADLGRLPAFKKTLAKFREFYLTAPLIVMGPSDRLQDLILAVQAGANRHVIEPLSQTVLEHAVRRTETVQLIQSELDYFRNSGALGITTTNSPNMGKLFDQAFHVANTNSTVLLLGETGVGKGVLAKLIHHHSNRKEMPFIHVHLGALSNNLIESELFGHEKGAFTGAVRRKQGRFEIAHGGTIFLDEIGTISLETQIKLLQVLQDNIMQRVGGETSITTDVRIIAATNDDLQQRSADGTFREDLYYRLNVFPLTVPSLKDRAEDIPILTEGYLVKLKAKYKKKIDAVSPEFYEALQGYPFPGNIRELENIVERAYILEEDSQLNVSSLPNDIVGKMGYENLQVDVGSSLNKARKEALEVVDRQYLTQLLARHKGKINQSAEAAGITTRMLHNLLTKYKIDKKEFK